MRPIRRRARAAALAVLALALALVAAGCGDLDGTTIGGPPGSAVASSSVKDGTVQVAIDPDWQSAAEQGLWRIGEEPDGSPDTFDFQVEQMGDRFGLDAYVDRSLDEARKSVPGLEVLSREQITLASGQPGARVVLGTDVAPARRFLVISAVQGSIGASIVVLSSADAFDEAVRTAEPYARTLRFV